LVKTCQLAVNLGHGLLQHAAMPGIGCGLKLANQVCPRQQKAIPFPVEFLLGSRHKRMLGRVAVGFLSLLLFYGFAFPSACHLGISCYVFRTDLIKAFMKIQTLTIITYL